MTDIEARTYPVHITLDGAVRTVDLFGPLGSRLVDAADREDLRREQDQQYARARRRFIEDDLDWYLRLN
jgi:hypothetical protein